MDLLWVNVDPEVICVDVDVVNEIIAGLDDNSLHYLALPEDKLIDDDWDRNGWRLEGDELPVAFETECASSEQKSK